MRRVRHRPLFVFISYVKTPVMNNWYVQILMLVLLLISITCQLEANEQEGAKEAFAEFQNAETTEELAESVTRKTAFEFGAVLLQDAQSFLRYLRRVKPVLEEGARGKIQEKLNETMETYKPENPENTDDRFRKARQSGREFFLDMVEFTNWIAEESDVSPHVNPDMYRKNIPGSNHCTFEKQSNSRVNVILDGDRVEVDGNSYLMSEGVEVVKQDDSWKVDKTGIMRYRNSDETKDRLHLRETLSTSSDPLDSFFEDPGNLPVHGEIKE